MHTNASLSCTQTRGKYCCVWVCTCMSKPSHTCTYTTKGHWKNKLHKWHTYAYMHKSRHISRYDSCSMRFQTWDDNFADMMYTCLLMCVYTCACTQKSGFGLIFLVQDTLWKYNHTLKLYHIDIVYAHHRRIRPDTKHQHAHAHKHIHTHAQTNIQSTCSQDTISGLTRRVRVYLVSLKDKY
jgi:hypothetical protein